ncbi:hypothetical protein [Bradyrhizobium sp. 1]|uniref:hypothetical protein n=1 Tax=Bradyrhizobium sp. 1 TaxID=241591 RepID=UPI001FFA3E89|nr:hypothetical protein [Bradyrhizobium sp. 1]MCK1390823.1 hypothetical protein [Bradyrhizobium sp. 1]
MTRFAALISLGLELGLGLGLSALAPEPAQAQDSGGSDRCFPWQEFRGGNCVAKAAPLDPPPAGTPLPSPPPLPERSETTAPPAPAPPRALIAITCIGGTASDGQCACPAGFQLMPSGTDPGGTCVRTNAVNCQGGALTVAGECLCDGQVTMSGQVYELELSRGKCVPKRCPREGPCLTAATKPEGEASPRLSSDEPERPRNCAKGMVATRHGCVSARHRSQTIDPGTFFRVTPNYPSPMHH